MSSKGKHWKLSEETKRKIGIGNTGKIVSLEARKKISISHKGKKYRLGKTGYKMTEEHKNKIVESCKLFWKFRPERNKEYSQERMGEKNGRWKGGKKELRRKIMAIYCYRNWRNSILLRDNYTCQICGKRGGNLEADHYPKKFKKVVEENNINSVNDAILCNEMWDTNNGRVLCRGCHLKTFKL